MAAEPTQLPMIAASTDLSPPQLLQLAVQRGVDTEQLKQLMQLEREWKADRARDAFHAAMNAFRSEALEIVKHKRVSFGDTSYKHATLAHIVEVAAPALSRHGLSHRWETTQSGGNGADISVITVSCIITHELGHSERTTLSAAPDSSGKKNSIQAIGSTVTYLQRYTFTAITGLAAKDQDDDGGGGGTAVLTVDQATAIKDKIEDVKKVRPKFNPVKFYEWLGVETAEQIAAKDYQRAMTKLETNMTAG